MPQAHGSVDGSPPVVAAGPPPLITAMTGIRALAATWVLVGHSQFFLLPLFPAVRVFGPWTSTGFLGVDVFFLLSGFIISYNYAQRLPALDRRRYGAFLFARFGRIYPVHLVTFLVAAILLRFIVVPGVAPSAGHSLRQLAGNTLLLQALPGFKAWNPASWSISCEAAAYLVFPLGAGLLMRLSRRAALTVALLVVAVQLTVTMALGVSHPSHPPMSWVRIAGEFTLGCLLWAAWRHGVRPHWRWDVAALVAVGATVVVVGLVPKGSLSYLVVPLLAVFVVATASATGPVRAVLASRVMEWGGRVSYSLYLTHYLVLPVLMTFVLPPAAFAGASVPARFVVVALYVLTVVAVAAATYYLVEEPARRWLGRRAARWEAIGFDDRSKPVGALPAEPALPATSGRAG